MTGYERYLFHGIGRLILDFRYIISKFNLSTPSHLLNAREPIIISKMAAYQEYVRAKRDMDELMQVYAMIDQKLQSSLLKIQAVHAEQGEMSAKSIGDVEVTVVATRGLVEDAVIKVTIDPEDAYQMSDSEACLEWGSEQQFPTKFQFNSIVSREAMIQIVVEKDDSEEEPMSVFTIPVLSLIKSTVDEWYSVKVPVVVAESVSDTTEENELAEAVSDATEEETEEETVEPKADEPSLEAAVHIEAKLTLSEVETLAQNVLVLSKQKSELEAARQIAEQKLNQARLKNEQTNRSAMALKAQLGSAQRASSAQRRQLLGLPAREQTFFQRCTSSISSVFTPRRVELTKTVTIFVGSVLLFHFQGEQFAV